LLPAPPPRYHGLLVLHFGHFSCKQFSRRNHVPVSAGHRHRHRRAWSPPSGTSSVAGSRDRGWATAPAPAGGIGMP
jgi:hypothetical protein